MEGLLVSHKKYVPLQKIGYEDKFDVVYDIDEDTLDCKDKGFATNLVENSIRHGIKAEGNKAIIKISCKRQNGCLIFTVEDNSVGIDKERLKELNLKFVSTEVVIDNNHIGINNLNHRIQLGFGSEYGLTVHSEYGKMTIVTIKVPLID